jgi:alkylresorcinol/alkylpyrone synthase
MLKTVAKKSAARRAASNLHVRIAGMARALPRYRLTQAEAASRATRIFPHLKGHEVLFANTGIGARYTCEPPDWYEREHGWEERTQVFQHHAVDLLEEAARGAVAEAGIGFEDIGVLIVNTITGLAVPSLDAKLMNRLPLSPQVERVPLFGLGCGGGVGGLARAARFAQATRSHVLFLTVDLCSLCLRVNDPSLTMFVATALFGDGAAGVVLSPAAASSAPRGAREARVLAVGDHFWRDSEDIMGWDIRHDGFGVVLSPMLPQLLTTNLCPALQAFLDRSGMSLGGIDGFLLHPGGGKVLSTAAAALGLSREDLACSWKVLHDYGNMSSPTALFVLDEARRTKASGRHLLAAFGPGFAAYFAVIAL